jgi:hypothetical protein
MKYPQPNVIMKPNPKVPYMYFRIDCARSGRQLKKLNGIHPNKYLNNVSEYTYTIVAEYINIGKTIAYPLVSSKV